MVHNFSCGQPPAGAREVWGVAGKQESGRPPVCTAEAWRPNFYARGHPNGLPPPSLPARPSLLEDVGNGPGVENGARTPQLLAL